MANESGDVRFVYFGPGERTTTVGQPGDLERARRHRSGTEPMLWFVHEGHGYVVQDPAALQELQRIWDPVKHAAGAQAAGSAELGEAGGRLGALGVAQAAAAAKAVALAFRQAASGDEQRSEIAREREILNEQMQRLKEEMSDVATGMTGETLKQGGDRLADSANTAHAAMRDFFARIVSDGTAQRVS